MDFHLKTNSVSCNALTQTWVVAFGSGFYSPGEQEWSAGLHVVLLASCIEGSLCWNNRWIRGSFKRINSNPRGAPESGQHIFQLTQFACTNH